MADFGSSFSSLMERFAAQVSRLVSTDLESQISRAVAGWGITGGSQSGGSRGRSSPGAAGRQASPGFGNQPEFNLQPLLSALANLWNKVGQKSERSAPSSHDFMSHVVRWGMDKAYGEKKTGGSSLIERFLRPLTSIVRPNRGSGVGGRDAISSGPTPSVATGKQSRAEVAQNHQHDQSSCQTSLMDRFLRRLMMFGKPQRGGGMLATGADDTPASIVKMMLGQMKERSGRQAAWRKWQASRKGPIATLGRARRLALRAAERYQGLVKKRDALKGVADAARNRFLSAPGIGQVGYNAARTASLLKQSQIAGGAFRAAQAAAAGGFQRLGQATGKFAAASSGMLGKMAGKAVGFVGKFAAPLSAAQITAAVPGVVQWIADAKVNTNRWQGNYSTRTNMAFTEYDRMSENLKFRESKWMERSQRFAMDQVNQFRENVFPFRTAVKDLGNWMFGGVMAVANRPFNMARDFGLFTAGGYAHMFDSKWWKENREAYEEKRKEDQALPFTQPQMMMGMWSTIADREVKNARNTKRMRDMLPPLK